MELDFSKLIDEIAAGGNEDPASRAGEKPYTPVKAPLARGSINVPTVPERRENRPSDFQNTYGKMYRAAFDFQKEHSPPPVDEKYWADHIAGEDELPGIELAYWEKTALDIAETANRHGNDPFLMGLLNAVMDELGREYEKRRRSR